VTGALAELFARCGRGELPPADGRVEVVEAPLVGAIGAAVYSFTAHLVVATDVAARDVHAVAPADDFGAWGRVASWLAERLGTRAFSGDVLLCGRGDGSRAALALDEVDAYEHPRVARASRYREDVRVFVTADRAGVLVLGRGVGGRYEMAFEVEPSARGRGLGRQLAACAPALVPEGEAVWAQVHPGNAASLRPVLAAGFRPVGFEQLVGSD
jgi:GNAT superfamily N-acetyltransferase